MTQYLSQQSLLALLLWAFALGIGTGALYQLCLIRRAAFAVLKMPRILSVLWLNLEDFVISIGLGCALSILFFGFSNGVVRWMALPAAGAGVLLWRKTAGRLVDRCTWRILDCLARILRWCRGHLLSPVWQLICRADRKLRSKIGDWHEGRRQKRLWKLAKRETLAYSDRLVNGIRDSGLPVNEFQSKVRIKQ